MKAVSLHSEKSFVATQILFQMLEFSEAILKGDFTKRIITDYNDDLATRVADRLNRFADQMQMDPVGLNHNQAETVNTFIEVISSYTNLDFKRKLPISENGTILDAIATGINILGDELENSTASRKDLEREQLELKAAKRQAEAANKAKSSFLANMSHEIRTPMNGILGLTQIMLNETTNEDHRKYLEMIHQSGRNLSQLINDILDFSKIESGKLTLESIPFDFKHVVASNIETQRVQAQEKGLSLSYSFEPSLPREVLGDPVRFSQIVTNLVGNAIKFTHQGFVRIEFAQLERGDNYVVLQTSVTDSGVGIAEDNKAKIFQSFTQADESVTRKFGGSGLGLTIVKSLVEQMGGSIRVENSNTPGVNSGSSFIFSVKLPIPVKQGMKEPAKAPGSALVFSRKYQVLVVDDNPINLVVAKRMVKNFGGEVVTADSGMAALELLTDREFDIILLDLQMPELDGFETSRMLRKTNYAKPIMALSASAFVQDIQESLQAGMNAHMQKPFTELELFQGIEKHACKG